MRTTIDLPEDLHRTLKARAALDGTTLRELIQHLVEQGLRQPERGAPSASRSAGSRWGPPPVIVAPRGTPIEPLTSDQLRRLEEDEDVARLRSVP
jgi:hypothetical protein